jgi:hypothetical protein
MKLLGIALLLLNVALFAWQYNQRVEEATRERLTRPPLPAGAPKLELLSEMGDLPALRTPEAEAAPAPAIEPEVKADVAPADLCIEAGPFGDESARDGFRDWIGDLVATLQFRVETVRKRQLFWVYLEPTPDRDAEQSMADLRRRGVKDYMMIRRGGLKNAISLGLFRSQDSVNRRLAELNEQGYKPVVVPRYETTDRYWVAAQFAAAHDALPDIPEAVTGAAEVTEIECDLLPLIIETDAGATADEPTETN